MASNDVTEIKLRDGNAIEVGKDIAHRGWAILHAKNSTGHSIAVSASPAECDALIAAIGRALGRTPSDLARRALSVALRIDPYDNTESCTIAIEDAAEIAAILREVAAREQGATVPRAGVAAALAPVLTLHAQIAEECGRERTNAIELLLTALDEAQATLEAAGLWPLPLGLRRSSHDPPPRHRRR